MKGVLIRERAVIIQCSTIGEKSAIKCYSFLRGIVRFLEDWVTQTNLIVIVNVKIVI